MVGICHCTAKLTHPLSWIDLSFFSNPTQPLELAPLRLHPSSLDTQ